MASPGATRARPTGYRTWGGSRLGLARAIAFQPASADSSCRPMTKTQRKDEILKAELPPSLPLMGFSRRSVIPWHIAVQMGAPRLALLRLHEGRRSPSRWSLPAATRFSRLILTVRRPVAPPPRARAHQSPIDTSNHAAGAATDHDRGRESTTRSSRSSSRRRRPAGTRGARGAHRPRHRRRETLAS